MERISPRNLKIGTSMRLDADRSIDSLHIVTASTKNYDGWLITLRPATDIEKTAARRRDIEKEIAAIKNCIEPYYVTDRSAHDADLKAQLAAKQEQLSSL